MTVIGSNAVVLGAGMSGLLAARVLAEHYRTVTVIERDILPKEPVSRRGVPHGRQPHSLLLRSSQILEQLFPGFLDELVTAGARVWDDGDLSRFCLEFNKHPFPRTGHIPDPTSLVSCHASRPLLEWHVRRRVCALANVAILEGHDVLGLTSTPDHSRVTGARVVSRDENVETAVTADLVVDATGRGSRSPVFLEELGYGRPPVDERVVHVGYASMPLRIPSGTLHEYLVGAYADSGSPFGFFLFAVEHDIYMVGVGKMGERELPTGRDELLDSIAELAPPHVLAAVRAAEPLAGISRYQYPTCRWLRYDKMRRTPEGLVALGDAISSFNPLYGQGITLAAIQSSILRDCLRRGEHGLPRRFYRASAPKIRTAWQISVGADISTLEVSGRPPLPVRIVNTYLDWVLTAAEGNPAVVQQFMRVTGMVDPPWQLLHPWMVFQAIQARRRRVPPTA